jgi:L-fuculose-phosphate aldolase
MLLEQERDDVVRTCRELAAAGLVVGTSGNVSVRAGDLIAVSPSGLDYGDLTPGLVGVHRLDGTPVDARLRPTTEMPLHLAVYAATGAGAIVHTHPVAATAVSTLTTELPAIHYQVAMFGGPVPVAPYATYGTEQLARNVVAALKGTAPLEDTELLEDTAPLEHTAPRTSRTACLMANHGALTTGADLKSALTGTRYLEWTCEVYLRALSAGQPGGPRLLPASEIALVAGQLTSYGQRVPDDND